MQVNAMLVGASSKSFHCGNVNLLKQSKMSNNSTTKCNKLHGAEVITFDNEAMNDLMCI